MWSRRAFLRAAAAASFSAPRVLSAAAEPRIAFRSGAAAAGLDFVLRNGATGRKYQVETLPGGLAVIDFDADGWPDLFCTNGAALPSLEKSAPSYWNRLYRNNRDGTFTDVTAKAGLAGAGYNMGATVGDYNNDGFDDIFVVGVHANFLYRNNGDGTFTDVTAQAGLAGPGSLPAPAWSVSACWIDYDNDGHLDLFISNYCEWQPGADPLCGGIAEGARAYCHPDRYAAQRMQLFHNNGDGTFTEVTRNQGLPDLLGKGMGIAMADFSSNGSAGLFIANDNARNLLLGISNGRLAEIGVDAGVAYNGDGRNISGMGADAGDINGDGLADIVMTGLKNETYELFLNRGHALFDDGSVQTGLLNLTRRWSGWGCGLADLDNDGWLDLFVAGGGLDTDDAESNRIYRNAQGRFEDITATVGADFQQPALHRAVVFADFNRDGRIDAAVSALNAPLELWWNVSPPVHHWLQLRLIGRASNRSAIGAVVHCRAAGQSQVRMIAGAMGYASCSDRVVHFGLAAQSHADVEIHWPSGRSQVLPQVAADQRIDIVEPA